MLTIYTDGSVEPNPGNGGWAAIVCRFSKPSITDVILYGYEEETTNNRMEMMGPLLALETVPCLQISQQLTIYSDSAYLIEGASEWAPKWAQREWRRRKNREIKNLDLWQRLIEAASIHTINWQWIRGHNGHAMNERVDALANEARRLQKRRTVEDQPSTPTRQPHGDVGLVVGEGNGSLDDSASLVQAQLWGSGEVQPCKAGSGKTRQ